MAKYIIEITETLVKHIEIEAESSVDAAISARQMYRKGEIILTADDYADTEIRAISKNKNKDYMTR